ncbi:MAG: hypothetical protein ACOVQN_02530 [Exiguobacterium sp.]
MSSIDPRKPIEPFNPRESLRTQTIESMDVKATTRNNVLRLIKKARQTKTLKSRGMTARSSKSKKASPKKTKPQVPLSLSDDETGTELNQNDSPVVFEGVAPVLEESETNIPSESELDEPTFSDDPFKETASTELETLAPEIEVPETPEYSRAESSTPVDLPSIESLDEGSLEETTVSTSEYLTPEQHRAFKKYANNMIHQFKHNPTIARVFESYLPRLKTAEPGEAAALFDAWHNLIAEIVRNSSVRLQQWVFELGIVLSKQIPNKDIAMDVKMKFQQANSKYHIYSPEHLEPDVYDNISRFISRLVNYLGEEPRKWEANKEFSQRLVVVANKLFSFMDNETAMTKRQLGVGARPMSLVDALRVHGKKSPFYTLRFIKAALDVLEEQRKADRSDSRIELLTDIYRYVVNNFIDAEERPSYFQYWNVNVDDYYEMLFDKLQILGEVFYTTQQSTSDEAALLGVTADDIIKIFGNQISEPARLALTQASKVTSAQEGSVWELLSQIRKELYSNTAKIRQMNVRAKELAMQLDEKESVLQTLNQTRRSYAQLGTVISFFFGSSAVRAKTDQFRRAMAMVSRQGVVSVYGMIIVRLLFLYDTHTKTESHVSSSSASDDNIFEQAAESLITDLFNTAEDPEAAQKLNDMLLKFALILDKNRDEDVHFIQENVNIVSAFQLQDYDRMQNIFVNSISQYVKESMDMRNVFGAVKRYVTERTTYLSDEFRRDFDRRWRAAFEEDGRMNIDVIKTLMDHLLDTIVSQEIESAQIAQEYKNAQDDLHLLDAQVQETAAAAQAWSSKRDDLQKDIRRLETLIGDITQQVSQITDDRHQLEVQTANILRTSSAMAATSRLEQLEDTIRATESRQKTLSEQLKERARALSDARSEVMLIQTDLQLANDKLAELMERYTLKQNRIGELAQRIDIILKDYDAPSLDNVDRLSIEWFENVKTTLDTFYTTKYEPTLREITALRDERDRLNGEINITNINYQQIEQKYKDLQRDHELLKKRHGDLIFTLTQLYQRHADPQAQVDSVHDALEQLEKQLIAAANVVEDARFFERELKSKETQVRELLEAQVVTSAEIETLRQKKKDTRATFISLSELNKSLYDSNATLTETVDVLRRDLDQAQASVQSKESELQELQRDLNDTSEIKSRLEQELAAQTARINRLVTAEADDIDDTIASTIRELRRNREEIDKLKESTSRLSAENQTELDTRLATQRQLEALQEELEETKRDHELKVQEQRQALNALKDRYRNVDKKYSDIMSRREVVQRLINTDTLAAEKKSVRLRDLESQLAAEEEKLQRAQETIEQQRRIIEQTQAALKLAQSAQVQISQQTNMKPNDLYNMQKLIGAVAQQTNPSKEALRTLSDYLKKVPVHIDTKNVDDIVRAARSTAEEELIGNVDDIQETYRSIVKTATSLSENRRPLMETTQRQTSQQDLMAATDDYEDEQDVPRFTHTEPARPVVTNTFTTTSHPEVTNLIEIDDGYGSFSELMDIVTKEVGEFPAQVVDQFYSFTESVRGRVAAAKSFWLKDNIGMKALVAHAIDASEKVKHTVFPMTSTKQYQAFHNTVYDFYADMLKRTTPRDREEYNVGRFVGRIVDRLSAQWPGVRFTIEGSDSVEGITYEKNNSRNFLRDLTDATVAMIYVEQPGVSVTRASHLAVTKYIKSLFHGYTMSEVEKRARVLKSAHVHSGKRIMTLLQTMVDSTFYAAMQVAFDAAKVPMDFNDDRFVMTLYDPKMVDYVAAFYNQSYAQSRHSITAKRTTMFDLHISSIRETLRNYTPPGVSSGIRRIKKEERQSEEEEEEEYREYQGSAYIEDF